MKLLKSSYTFALVLISLSGQAQSVINVCKGGPATCSYSNPQEGYKYRWNSGEWTSESSFTVINVTSDMIVDCEVDTDGDGNSDGYLNYSISIYEELRAANVSGSQTICYGSRPNVLSISERKQPLIDIEYTYQWQVYENEAWNDISGANDDTYQPSLLTKTTQYRNVVRSQCGDVPSDVVTITVLPDLSNPVIGGSQTICFNTVPSVLSITTVPTGADGDFTHQWQVNDKGVWKDIPGATSISYQPTALTETTQYRLVSTSTYGCGTVTSNVVTVTVYNEISAGVISGDQTICYNTEPNALSVTSAPTGADGSFTNVWQYKPTHHNLDDTWHDIKGFTESHYQPTALSSSKTYRLMSTSTYGCGDVISNEVTVTVRPEFIAGAITGDEVICYNTEPSQIEVTSDCKGGDGVYSYQWQKSTDGISFTDVTGQTSKTFTPSRLTQSTYYRLKFINVCDTKESNAIFIQVYDDIKAAVIGGAQTICFNTVPSALSITTAPTGADGNFTYQWQFNDNGTWKDIPSATSVSYQPTALMKTTQYRLVSTSTYGCGTATSNVVTVTVYDEINAGVISADQTICYNTTPAALTFSTNPSGEEGVYTYKWYESTDNATFTVMSSKTQNTLTPSALTTTHYYKAEVTSVACATTDETNVVAVTVRPEFIAGAITGDEVICYNSKPSQIGVATDCKGGDGAYSYQWQKSNDGISFTDVTGQTSKTFTPSRLTQSTYYRLKFINVCDTKESNAIFIQVYDDIKAAVIGGAQTICFNTVPSALSITTVPTGADGNFTYQWQVKENGTWKDIADATTTSYQPSALTKTTQYRLVSTSAYGCGAKASNEVTITVYAEINAGAISSDQTICYNTAPAEMNFSTTPSGEDGSYSYKWYVSSDNVSFSEVNGATLNKLAPSALTATCYYKAEVTSVACSTKDETNVVTVIVRPEFIAGAITGDEVICYNTEPSQITMTSDCSGGDGAYSYQWQKSTDGVSFTDVAGQTSKTFTPSNLTQSTYYRLKFINVCDTKESNAIFIQVYDDIKTAVIGGTQSICFNTVPDALSITTAPTGADGNFTHQWQVDDNGSWKDIPGATSVSYQPTALTETTQYRLVSTSTYGCGTVISNVVTVTVYDEINAGVISADQTICYNTTPAALSFSTNPSGEEGVYTYKWYKSTDNATFTVTSGKSQNTLTPSALTTTHYYKAKVTSVACATTDETNVVTVTVRPEFIAGTISGNEEICYGNNASEKIISSAFSGGDGDYKYQWQYSSDNSDFSDIATANNVSYKSQDLYETTYYRLAVSDLCGTLTTNSVEVFVNPLPSEKDLIGDKEVCRNSPGVDYSLSFNEDEIIYNWTIIGGTIDGSDNNSSLVVDWDTTPSASLHLLQTNERTGCVLNTDYPILKKTESSPEQTDIVQKGNSCVLICAENGNSITYTWGYIDIATGVEHTIEDSNYRYVMYPSAIDVSKYNYFVKTAEGSCETTSFFDPLKAIVAPSNKSTQLTVRINPTPVETVAYVSVNTCIEGTYTISVVDLNGKLCWKEVFNGYQEGDNIPIPINLSGGIYMLSVECSDFILTNKMMVK